MQCVRGHQSGEKNLGSHKFSKFKGDAYVSPDPQSSRETPVLDVLVSALFSITETLTSYVNFLPILILEKRTFKEDYF